MAKIPPKPGLLPDFNPFHTDDCDGQPNLPPDVEQSDSFAISSQFFTDKIIEQLVERTNKCAGEAEQLLNARVWQLTYKQEV